MKLNRRNVRFAVVAAGLSLIPFAASAGDTMSRDNMGKKEAKAPLSQGDLQIMAKMHENNLMEIEMGKMAKAQGKHKDVKGFGKDLMKDHDNADQKIVKLSKKQESPIPVAEAVTEEEKAKKEEHAQTMSKLRSLSGPTFDREFATAMVKGHADTLMFLDQSLTKAESEDVRDLIEDVKPVVQRHLEKAQKLVETLSDSPRT